METSTNFERLHPEIKKWVYDKGWTDLREIQEQAIPAILDGNSNVVISSPTASGKTEAAFLPILSRILHDNKVNSLVIAVSPLKALINDQGDRLGQICERFMYPVFRWHGDVGAGEKNKFRGNPSGVLNITPESLDSLSARYPRFTDEMTNKATYVVIDELHYFLDGERGKQLQSVLFRIFKDKDIRIIGLSATISDPTFATKWLKTINSKETNVITTGAAGGFKAIIRGFNVEQGPLDDWNDAKAKARRAISEDILTRTQVEGNFLVFSNARNDIEAIGSELKAIAKQTGSVDKYLVHHGSISAEERKYVESTLKSGKGVCALATGTLELGIDIGDINDVFQVNPTFSIAALRQRMGRSGRRGSVPRLHLYSEEIEGSTGLLDAELRLNTAKCIASMLLMAKGQLEVPSKQPYLHLLPEQIMATIMGSEGLWAKEVWEKIGQNRIFNVTGAEFAEQLKWMGTLKLIEQGRDGTLNLGEKGERETAKPDFTVVFAGEAQISVVVNGRRLGFLQQFPEQGKPFMLAGKRLVAVSMDIKGQRLEAKEVQGVGFSKFYSGMPDSSALMMSKVKDVLASETEYPFLDATAKMLITKGRRVFRGLKLHETSIFNGDGWIRLFPWTGTHAMRSIKAIFVLHDIDVEMDGLSIKLADCGDRQLRNVLDNLKSVAHYEEFVLESDECRIMAETQVDPVRNEEWLCETLRNKNLVGRVFDFEEALRILSSIS